MISTAQALALGETYDKIRWYVKIGRWQRVHQGVYATFSGELSRGARLWAVILRVGDHAVLSHETAAEIQGFADRLSDQIHVTVPVQVTPTRWSQLPRCRRAPGRELASRSSAVVEPATHAGERDSP